jgi:hypothetical protein
VTAPTPLLQSPLPGWIHPPGSSWSGGEFGVISDLADHIRTGRGRGSDIASFPTAGGQPVRLMRSGYLYQKYRQPYHNPPQIGDGALILRFRDAAGNDGYAHLEAWASDLVIGRWYTAGKIIGWVGKSGTSHYHLHCHWQTPDGVHHEVYWQLEQSRNLQFNGGVNGVRIRSVPGLAGAIIGTVGPGGIVRKSDGKVVAPAAAILTRRHVVHLYKDGYWWEPILVGGLAGWTARPFIHFV